MSETETPAWVWQGFEGPTDLAATEKALHEPLLGTVPPTIGAMVPLPGLPPIPWCVSGERAMFAVQVRPDRLLPVPAGMLEARSDLVGRLVGA